MMKGLRGTIGVLTLVLMTGAYARDGRAQEKKPTPRAELEAEITRLRSALAECQSEKASKRDDAIASLRAIRSALSTGANFEEFKKYQIESRIKVDALPHTPANQDVRAISDLFADAIAFRIAQITGGEFDAAQINSAKERYPNDPEIQKALNAMKSEDVVRTLKMERPYAGSGLSPAQERTEAGQQLLQRMAEDDEIPKRTAHAINAESARYISQLLIITALKLLSALN
jgi:hypothetical protein